MPQTRLSPVAIAAALIFILAACATTLPPEYDLPAGEGYTLDREVLAVAAGGGEVVVATPSGLWRRSDGAWTELPAPGIADPGKVTCLALAAGELLVGTDRDGLHILSGDQWSRVDAAGGALPDDRVTAIAVETADRPGLAGDNIWVGTRSGLAMRRDGQWQSYAPGGRWLKELVGKGGSKTVYMTSGFRYGMRGAAGKAFSPWVTAIGVGSDRVVLGGRGGRMAILTDGAFASVRLKEKADIVSLLVDDAGLWCGTDNGLFWGALYGRTSGRPYPSWRAGFIADGTLFGARDSRLFHYSWFRFGYNSALVADLARDGSNALWVLYRLRGARNQPALEMGRAKKAGTSADRLDPAAGTRRYVNVDEYLASHEQPYYENYSRSFGIRGEPAAATYDQGTGILWLGTTSELVGLAMAE